MALNVSFLLQGPLPGVSQFAVVYSLMKQAKTLGAFKIAKHALTLLQNLKIPTQFQVNPLAGDTIQFHEKL